MRFALITDVHVGPEARFRGKLRKLTAHSLRLVDAFVQEMNQTFHPDLVINLGDVVEDQDPAHDLENYGAFMERLARLCCPVLNVAGNHDSIHLTDAELARFWKHNGPLYYSCDLGPLHFVVLRTEETRDLVVGLPEKQLTWLEADLAQASLPSVVLMHHPASEMSFVGNRWFEQHPELALVENRRALRRILQKSGKVAAVFNGHVHWNHCDVHDAIPYVSVQSLIENLDDDAPGRPARAFAQVRVESDALDVEVLGEERLQYRFSLPTLAP